MQIRINIIQISSFWLDQYSRFTYSIHVDASHHIGELTAKLMKGSPLGRHLPSTWEGPSNVLHDDIFCKTCKCKVF